MHKFCVTRKGDDENELEYTRLTQKGLIKRNGFQSINKCDVIKNESIILYVTKNQNK